MLEIKVIGKDFECVLSVDAPRCDESGELSIVADEQAMGETLVTLSCMAVDDRGIPMSKDSASINGIAMAMLSYGYAIEYDEQEIEEDLDGY